MSQCKGVVSARYHGLIHAIKANTPVLAVGWAKKYNNIMSLLNCKHLLIDISADNLDELCDKAISEFLPALDKLRKENSEVFSEICSNNIIKKYL